MTDERIAEIERAHSGTEYAGVVHALIAALRQDRETLRQHQECAADLLDAIREAWKAVELPPDALTLYMASFIAGFARAWEHNPPQNGFVNATQFPGIGTLQLEVRRIDGKSAAESLAEMRQQLRTAEEQRDYELNRAEQGAEDTEMWDWMDQHLPSYGRAVIRAAMAQRDAAMAAEQEAKRA